MVPHEVNSSGNFIAAWNNKYSQDLCNDIIHKFKATPNHLKFDNTNSSLGNTSLDCSVMQPGQFTAAVNGIIKPAFDQYFELYPAALQVHYFDLLHNNMIIHHWSPGKGYELWFHEKDGKPLHEKKHLAFSLFLNNVSEGGEEEFLHQKIKFKPEAGLIIIWPTTWTHSHRTCISPKDEKYILTGYLTFEDEKIE